MFRVRALTFLSLNESLSNIFTVGRNWISRSVFDPMVVLAAEFEITF